jgi:transcriptional regulator with XRE-family HTH domain
MVGMDAPTTTLNERVAEEIRALLARRRLTATDLARLTGMTQRSIARRVSGEKVIDIDDLARIAAALDCQIADLLPTDLADRQPVAATPIRRSRDRKTTTLRKFRTPIVQHNRPARTDNSDQSIRRTGRRLAAGRPIAAHAA